MLDPSWWLWAAALLALFAAGLMVLSALLERSGPIRLRHFSEEAGGRLRQLLESPHRFEAFRYLLSFWAKVLPAAFAAALLQLLRALGVGDGRAMLWALVATGLFILGIELLNRVLVGNYPELALAKLTPSYRLAQLLLAPGIALVAPLIPRPKAHRHDEPEEDDEASEEEIEAFIDVGTREGILEPGQGDLVRGVVDFGDTQVKSVMTPRIDIVAAPSTTGLDELADRFIESSCSRIPLYADSVDHVIGILHIRDLLRGLRSEPRPSAVALAKPAYHVPLTKALDELLRELQARFAQMAIVVDEYGGTAGLVTVEDLVEEIVGDLGDEHEELEVRPAPLPDGAWSMEGRTKLSDLEEIFGVELEDEVNETVAGLLLSELGEVPEVDAQVEIAGLRFTVEKVSERRIERVRVERAGVGAGGEEG